MPPSLLTSNSREPRRRATARSSSRPSCGQRGVFVVVDISATISSTWSRGGEQRQDHLLGNVVITMFSNRNSGELTSSSRPSMRTAWGCSTRQRPTVQTTGGHHYNPGAAAASNGKIIFAPYKASSSPVNGARRRPQLQHTGSSARLLLEIPAAASNGKIIFAPFNADGVGVFDPSDNSFALHQCHHLF